MSITNSAIPLKKARIKARIKVNKQICQANSGLKSRTPPLIWKISSTQPKNNKKYLAVVDKEAINWWVKVKEKNRLTNKEKIKDMIY